MQTLDKMVVCRVRDGLRGRKVCEDGRFARMEKVCEDANLGQWMEGLRGRKLGTEGRFARTQTLDRINVITTPCRCGIQGL